MRRGQPTRKAPIRKSRKVDKAEFERLCALQCTQAEVAAFFQCDVDTVENFCLAEYGKRFSDVFREKRQNGFISLRRAQFVMAQKNPAMAIFLGKNYLGQKDVKQIDAEMRAKVESRNIFEGVSSETLEKLADMSEEEVAERLAAVGSDEQSKGPAD